MTANADGWRFFLDAGGTFTDCIAIPPDGPPRRRKVLSSGIVRAELIARPTATCLQLRLPPNLPDNFFADWYLRLEGNRHQIANSANDAIELATKLDCELATGTAVDLETDLPAPIVATRLLAGLALEQPLGSCQIRLGTTRATNALLEGKTARTALVTTRGFGDVPAIGDQSRPDLFELAIRKPQLLHDTTVEIDERIAVDGTVLGPLDPDSCRQAIAKLRDDGVEAVAIALMHAWLNPDHEEQLAAIAAELGFTCVSVSSRLSRAIGLLDRMQTTIADAALSPVLADYVNAIRAAAPAAELLLMTSAGALAPPAQFAARDAVLSGPAGGVVGLARVAKEAAAAEVIGFDMGGTSTDVCRYAGALEYEQVTEKAGIRIVAPTVAVHTVAAGGGSICGFDGRRLTVGPASAGANPGPACYGRGGPLAVTDLNLYTRRLVADQFPFPLDPDAVNDRLDELRIAIREQAGIDYSRDELVRQFLQIANEKMSAAIHRITTSRGCSPGEHALVSFGGAGAQHACAIADLLGISRIIQHPDAAILSAIGISNATISRQADRSILKPLTTDTLNEIDALADDQRRQLRQQIAAADNDPDAARFTVTLDLRYQGELATIPISYSGHLDDLQSAFESAHLRLNGHLQERPVEVAACRFELAAPAPDWQDPVPAAPNRPPSTNTRAVLFDNWHHSRIIPVAELPFDHTITGPAIFHEPRSTIVIPPHWQATRQPDGLIILNNPAASPPQTDHQSPITDNQSPTNGHSPSPALLELFANRFTHVAVDMGLALQRSAISVNVRDRLDFSCAILDAAGRLVVNAPHVPVHLGAMSQAVQSLLAAKVDLRPGDAWLDNDPDAGGSHLPDLTVITPVFDEFNRLAFFTASRAHHAEIGGLRPGSCFPFATSLAEEGVLFQRFLLVRDGQFREAQLRRHLTAPPHPSRSPDENVADLRAQIAANHRGADGLQQLMTHHGRDQVTAYARHLCDAAAEQCRQAIRAFPDGLYQFSDKLDSGAPLCVMIRVNGDAMRIDFTGTGAVNPDSLNANRAIVRAVVLYCLRCLIAAPIPLNDGVLEPVTLVIPESFLNPPGHPNPSERAPTAGGNTEVSQRIVDLILGALKLAAASQGTMNNLVFGNDHFGYYETLCGGSGATPDSAGADAVHTHMTNTRITDPERLEHTAPIRVIRCQIRPHSGGPGLHPGGNGLLRELLFLERLELSLLTQRRLTAPFGLNGGAPGKPGENTLHRADGDREALGPLAQTLVNPGDRLTIATPGGGAFGKEAGDR